jgi:hypothetical protein
MTGAVGQRERPGRRCEGPAEYQRDSGELAVQPEEDEHDPRRETKGGQQIDREDARECNEVRVDRGAHLD